MNIAIIGGSTQSQAGTVTGTEFNYYLLCKRKLWLFSHDVEMEHTSDNVLLGKLIDEESYPKEKRHDYRQWFNRDIADRTIR